jgi:hypothetical protein
MSSRAKLSPSEIDALLEDVAECPVCYECMVEPKTLRCGHNVCATPRHQSHPHTAGDVIPYTESIQKLVKLTKETLFTDHLDEGYFALIREALPSHSKTLERRYHQAVARTKDTLEDLSKRASGRLTTAEAEELDNQLDDEISDFLTLSSVWGCMHSHHSIIN